ncbi:4637_t:CDS:10, partial [Funneliformis geosporum]
YHVWLKNREIIGVRPQNNYSFSDFKFKGILGEGRSGKTLLCEFRGDMIALKSADLSKAPSYVLEEMQKEVEMYKDLADIQGKYIPKLICYGYYGGGMSFVIGLTIVGTTLSDQKITEQQKSRAIKGLEAIHKHGILHNDIREENILINDNDDIYLIDFGMASREDTKKKRKLFEEEQLKLSQLLDGYIELHHTSPKDESSISEISAEAPLPKNNVTEISEKILPEVNASTTPMPAESGYRRLDMENQEGSSDMENPPSVENLSITDEEVDLNSMEDVVIIEKISTEPSEPLVTFPCCKHIVHFECIKINRKLCPKCPTNHDLEKEGFYISPEIPRKRRRQEGGQKTARGSKAQTILRELSVFTLDELSINAPSEALNMQDVSNQLHKMYYDIDVAEKKGDQANRDVVLNYFRFGKALSERLAVLLQKKPPQTAHTDLNSEVQDKLPDHMNKSMDDRPGPDYKEARNWEKRTSVRAGSSFHFHNSTITGNSLGGDSGVINNVKFPKERNRERDQKEKQQRGRTQEKSNSLDHNTVNKTKGSSVAEISSEGKQTERCSKDGRDNKNLDFSTRSESTLECDDDDNSRIMSAYDYEKYKKSYAEMNNSNKWVLTTGTVVEDALYNFGLRCKYEHLAHSFILDPDDNNYLIESVFTESELHEIRHYQTKETPLMPLELLKLLEYESNALMSDHLELWILVHVWNFTDKVFNDIEEVKVVSLSSSTRKNHKRTVPAVDKKRKILGRRGDMIIRKITDEYGCAEAGRQFEGQNGTKLLQEKGLKMPKMMKDMFDQLCRTFDQDEKKTRKLETIGFLHAGLMMTLLRLDSPAGYICRVSRSKPFFIATHIKEFGKKTLPAIALTWKAKKIVDNMICLVGQPDESDEESQLQHLQDIYDVSPQPSQKRRVNLPTCLNTPSKDNSISLYFALDLLGPPPPFNLLSSIVSCPDPQCEGKNKDTAKICSDCGKPLME